MRALPPLEGAPGPGAIFSSDPSLQKPRHYISPPPASLPHHRKTERSRQHLLHIEAGVRTMLIGLNRASYVGYAGSSQPIYTAAVILTDPCIEQSGLCFHMNFLQFVSGPCASNRKKKSVSRRYLSRRPFAQYRHGLNTLAGMGQQQFIVQKPSYEVEPQNLPGRTNNLRNAHELQLASLLHKNYKQTTAETSPST